ncbi:single-stranded DNA-binding protein [Bacillus kwashiorkori]|uniref:single-stranded DNA-binding protein n=1 Tax=Bacillus kwashiorkori TaxID=1522318 RepID=UPI000781169A|nr:single-stranded DNA-binding protein [Bacillus kwashiorkori]
MLNQVTLVGRLTRDPEIKFTNDGIPVTQVIIAVSRGFRDNNGIVQADFVQCTLWRKVAENTAQYCKKGSIIGITGRIQTRNYENQEGRKIYVTEVVADRVRFLGGRPQEDREFATTSAD